MGGAPSIFTVDHDLNHLETPGDVGVCRRCIVIPFAGTYLAAFPPLSLGTGDSNFGRWSRCL